MRERGFTLMELLVVLALVAVLAGLVTPIVSSSIQRAKEATLKENLFVLRKAIDDYYADAGAYPPSLDVLVEKRYVRKVPVDPITERADSWQVALEEEGGDEAGIIDVHSGAEETAADGSAYREW
jgi:general secretion pathway protein G